MIDGDCERILQGMVGKWGTKEIGDEHAPL